MTIKSCKNDTENLCHFGRVLGGARELRIELSPRRRCNFGLREGLPFLLQVPLLFAETISSCVHDFDGGERAGGGFVVIVIIIRDAQ